MRLQMAQRQTDDSAGGYGLRAPAASFAAIGSTCQFAANRVRGLSRYNSAKSCYTMEWTRAPLVGFSLASVTFRSSV